MAWRMDGGGGLRGITTTAAKQAVSRCCWGPTPSCGSGALLLGAGLLGCTTWAACDAASGMAGQPFKWVGSKSRLLDEGDRGVPGGLLSAGLKRTGKADSDVTEDSPFKEPSENGGAVAGPLATSDGELRSGGTHAAGDGAVVSTGQPSGWSLLLAIMRECWVPLVAVVVVTVGLATLTVRVPRAHS